MYIRVVERHIRSSFYLTSYRIMVQNYTFACRKFNDYEYFGLCQPAWTAQAESDRYFHKCINSLPHTNGF